MSTLATDVESRLSEAVQGSLARGSDGDLIGGMRPRWVASPASVDEVSAVLRLASDSGLAVVPRGAGTRLQWGAAPSQCDVVLDLDPAGRARRAHLGRPRRGRAGGYAARRPPGAARLGRPVARGRPATPRHRRRAGRRRRRPGRPGCCTDRFATSSSARPWFGPTASWPSPAARWSRTSPGTTSASCSPAPTGRSAWSSRWRSGCTRSRRPAAGSPCRCARRPRPRTSSSASRTPTSSRPVSSSTGRVAPVRSRCGSTASPAASKPGRATRSPSSVTAPLSRTRPQGGGGPSRPAATSCSGYPMRSPRSAGRSPRSTARPRRPERTRIPAAVPASERSTSSSTGVTRLPPWAGCGRPHTAFGGTVVVRDAPTEVKAAVDVWGPVRGLDLMRRVKDQFDPHRVLSPGRFVGGI